MINDRYTKLSTRRAGPSRDALACLLLAAALTAPAASGAPFCSRGEEVVTGIGDGVSLRTCLLEHKPGQHIRVGPLELVKNGVLILKTQTNIAGKLHGQFVSWSDEGVILERGNYVEGLKEGIWLVTDRTGERRELRYREGKIIEQ